MKYLSPQNFESEELHKLMTADERGFAFEVQDQESSQFQRLRDTARAHLPSFGFGFFCATLVFALYYYSISKSPCTPEFKAETYCKSASYAISSEGMHWKLIIRLQSSTSTACNRTKKCCVHWWLW